MTTHHPSPRKQPADQGWNRGFTLSETIIVVFLIGIVTAIVMTSVQNSIERARMASCMMELRGIQAALWHDMDGGNQAINPMTFWDTHYNGTKPGPFVLMVDPAVSADGREPGSPGFGAGADWRGDSPFVVVGRYAHWAPGQYVYIEGDQPPQLVTSTDTDPGYGEQIDWVAGRQWGEGASAAASSPNVAWTGTQSNGTSWSPSSGGGGGQATGRPSSGAGSTGSSAGTGRTTTSRIGD